MKKKFISFTSNQLRRRWTYYKYFTDFLSQAQVNLKVLCIGLSLQFRLLEELMPNDLQREKLDTNSFESCAYDSGTETGVLGKVAE